MVRKRPISNVVIEALKDPWWYVWGMRLMLVFLTALIALSITFGAICAIHGGWEWGP